MPRRQIPPRFTPGRVWGDAFGGRRVRGRFSENGEGGAGAVRGCEWRVRWKSVDNLLQFAYTHLAYDFRPSPAHPGPRGYRRFRIRDGRTPTSRTLNITARRVRSTRNPSCVGQPRVSPSRPSARTAYPPPVLLWNPDKSVRNIDSTRPSFRVVIVGNSARKRIAHIRFGC